MPGESWVDRVLDRAKDMPVIGGAASWMAGRRETARQEDAFWKGADISISTHERDRQLKEWRNALPPTEKDLDATIWHSERYYDKRQSAADNRSDLESALLIGRPRAQAIEHQAVAAMLRGDRISPPKHYGEDVAKQIHSQAVGSAQYHLSEARKLRETNSATDPFARLSQAENAWASAPTGVSHSRHDPAPVAQHTLGL